MLCLLLGGALLVGVPLEVQSLALAGMTLLSGATLATHLNVLTDVELDRRSRPHLADGLRQHWKVSRYVLACEAAATIAGLAMLALCGGSGAASMLGIGICLATLYSYNFLARDPVKRRLKVTWWTHAIVFLGGYFTLWLTGALCSPTDHHGRIRDLWPLMGLASVSDYGLALAESGLDARDEREHGLGTLAALFGPGRTAYLAAALHAAVAGALIALSPNSPEARWAFLPSASLTTTGTLWLARNRREHRTPSDTVVPDFAFFVSRLYLIAALLLIRSHG
jgi:4-hydroxybenzoate polyprenyltransferase